MPRKRKEEMEREAAEGKINKPHQRYAANARERSRMRVLSKAFSRLKTTLPWVPPDTKLSKLDTLRLASSYIAHLKQILDHEETIHSSRGTFIHPLNLTWPFTFSSRTFGSSPTTSPRSTNTGNNNNNNICVKDNVNKTIVTTNTTPNNAVKIDNVNNNCNNIMNNNNGSNNSLYSNNNLVTGSVRSNNNNNSTLFIPRNHHQNLLDAYCNGGLSPVSDSSSLNEHDLI